MKLNFRPNRKPRSYCAAYTLVEVMIGSALFAMCALASYLGLAQGLQILQLTREDLRATQILQDKTEIIRLYTWEQLTNSAFISSSFTDYFNPAGVTNGSSGAAYFGTVTITNAPMTEGYAADLKLVTFQLSWTNHDTLHQRQIITLASRYGLHNYIYGSK
jgi:Prokaryotic N-terminal methylation motif